MASFQDTAFSNTAFAPTAFDFGTFVPGSWVGVGSVGGWASSETGVMGSNYLADGVPVPAGAHWRNGFAHSADGRRYVCPWPAAGIVHYRGKVAARPDGAMCIATAGTNAAVSRWALTARGEVLATESAPELVADGVGQLANGFVCLENVN